jgi:regulator of sirC expression with transglutaminase-like and TPR domain
MIKDIYSDDTHRFETPEDALLYLRHVGTLKDDEIDLGETALALGLIFLPGIHVDRYRQHLRKLEAHVHEEYLARLRLKEPDSLKTRVHVLRKIIHDAHGYAGDERNYGDLQNANFIRVIERRKGLPIALGLLYLILARKQGWQIDGLNFPGHFIVRMEYEGERVILDPFREGTEMNAAELRQLLKIVAGAGAELAHDYYSPVSSRDTLVRLENNIKKRLIETEDYVQALLVIEAMEAIAPDEYRTLFDKGILYVKLGHRQHAITALERYITKVPTMREKAQATTLLQQIRESEA